MSRGTPDLLSAVHWVTEAKSLKWRHDRAVAFMFATLGTKAFPRCDTVTEVCDQCDVSDRTMRAYLEALRDGFGLRPPGGLASDLPTDKDNDPRKTNHFAADETE